MGNINVGNRLGVVLGSVARYALKLFIALVLLFWLYHQGVLDLKALYALKIDARFLVAFGIASALVFGAVVLLSVRLMLVLRLQGIAVPFCQCFGLTMIGCFFGSVLPGLVAGDAVKAVYMVRGNEKGKSKAVAAVIVDRLIGFYSLFVLGSVASLVAWIGARVQVEMYPILIIAPSLTLAGTLLLAVLMMLDYRSGTLPYRMISRLPRKVQNLIFVLADYAKNGARLTQAIGISILSHALVVFAFFAMAVLVRDSLSVGQHFVLDPLAMVLNVVPLTPGGLGITEGAFAYLFRNSGSTNGALIGLLGRAAQYLVFAIGGVISILMMKVQGAVKLED